MSCTSPGGKGKKKKSVVLCAAADVLEGGGLKEMGLITPCSSVGRRKKERQSYSTAAEGDGKEKKWRHPYSLHPLGRKEEEGEKAPFDLPLPGEGESEGGARISSRKKGGSLLLPCYKREEKRIGVGEGETHIRGRKKNPPINPDIPSERE